MDRIDRLYEAMKGLKEPPPKGLWGIILSRALKEERRKGGAGWRAVLLRGGWGAILACVLVVTIVGARHYTDYRVGREAVYCLYDYDALIKDPLAGLEWEDDLDDWTSIDS